MTPENKALEVLKSAILLERKGKALYSRAATHTESGAARELFEFLAREEDEHVEHLGRQFRHFIQTGQFAVSEKPLEEKGLTAEILTKRIAGEISAADYEAAVIQAAIGFEEQAIRTYGERAASTADPQEKKLYEELVAFEKEHLTMLVGMNREITESVWFDNRFWPY